MPLFFDKLCSCLLFKICGEVTVPRGPILRLHLVIPAFRARHRASPADTRDCPRPLFLAASLSLPRSPACPDHRSSSAHIPCPVPNPCRKPNTPPAFFDSRLSFP